MVHTIIISMFLIGNMWLHFISRNFDIICILGHSKILCYFLITELGVLFISKSASGCRDRFVIPVITAMGCISGLIREKEEETSYSFIVLVVPNS